MKNRLTAIAKCTDELERLRLAWTTSPRADFIGIQLGELDWLEELHRLLFNPERPQCPESPLLS